MRDIRKPLTLTIGRIGIMSNIDKQKFEVDGTAYYVKKPTVEDHNEAQKVYNSTLADAIKSGAILRLKLDDVMEEQGVWTQKKEEQLTTLNKKLSQKENVLRKGGIKVSEAQKIAMEMRELRGEIRDLLSKRIQMDSNTAEGQAENSKFNFLVHRCTVYYDNKEKRYFETYEDYLNAPNVGVAVQAANILANLMYSGGEDYEGSLTEIKFLKKFGFMDDKNRFVKDGKLYDYESGHYLDENGFFVLENGTRCNRDGEPIEQGDIETAEFIDDLEVVETK